jgi:hypothetical protein
MISSQAQSPVASSMFDTKIATATSGGILSRNGEQKLAKRDGLPKNGK